MGCYHELQESFYEEGALRNAQVPYLVGISDRVINYKQPLTMLPQYKFVVILQQQALNSCMFGAGLAVVLISKPALNLEG